MRVTRLRDLLKEQEDNSEMFSVRDAVFALLHPSKDDVFQCKT